MTLLLWVIGTFGLLIFFVLYDISKHLYRVTKLLEIVADEMAFANEERREEQRRRDYPNSP